MKEGPKKTPPFRPPPGGNAGDTSPAPVTRRVAGPAKAGHSIVWARVRRL